MLEVKRLAGAKYVFLDTETTGLFWHQNNLPFLIIVKTIEMTEPLLLKVTELSKEEFLFLKKFFANPELCVIAHNAKFDCHMLQNIGIDMSLCTIYDTMTMHRHVINNDLKYSLEHLSGVKDDAVKQYIKKNAKTCKEIESVIDGVKKYKPCYWKIPDEVLLPYAKQDVVAVEKLYFEQQKMLPEKSLAFEIDLQCTSVLFHIERQGIKLDVDYCKAALAHEKVIAEAKRQDFLMLTGKPFVDSGKSLAGVFKGIGVELPKTEKGNDKIVKSFLQNLAADGNRIAQTIIEIREAEKMASTYYGSYLRFLNPITGKIHANFRQFGADTGRMSCSEPNIQNVPNEDEEGTLQRFTPRMCFVPDNDDFNLVSIDFQAQEMRCFLDTAGETEMIAAIMRGEDVHQATADMMGVKRKQAKSIGFGIIYGEGITALSCTLGVDTEIGRRMRDLYFSKLPEAQKLSKGLITQATLEGQVVTRFGNKLFITQGMEYKAVNYFVQGTCAMHTKNAAVKVFNFLKGRKSSLVALIHDELLLHMHKSELRYLKEIQELMIAAYPSISLPMGTSVEIYAKNWCGEVLDVKNWM